MMPPVCMFVLIILSIFRHGLIDADQETGTPPVTRDHASVRPDCPAHAVVLATAENCLADHDLYFRRPATQAGTGMERRSLTDWNRPSQEMRRHKLPRCDDSATETA
jgi:hypothetical protein